MQFAGAEGERRSVGRAGHSIEESMVQTSNVQGRACACLWLPKMMFAPVQDSRVYMALHASDAFNSQCVEVLIDCSANVNSTAHVRVCGGCRRPRLGDVVRSRDIGIHPCCRWLEHSV